MPQVVFVNRSENEGGAAQATRRLYQEIKKDWKETEYVCLTRQGDDASVVGHSDNFVLSMAIRAVNRFNAKDSPLAAEIQATRLTRNAISLIHPFWSHVRSSDIVHFNWMSMGTTTFRLMRGLTQPIVWTLHDMWPFTGGCHYSGFCARYEIGCGRCPAIGSQNQEDFSAKQFRKKKVAFSQSTIFAVSPSRWLAKKAEKSPLFENVEISVIPNGVSSSEFRLMDRDAARESLGIHKEGHVVSVGAEYLGDKRKGFDLFLEGINQIRRPLTIMVYGKGRLPRIENPYISIKHLGFIAKPEQMSTLFSASDLYCCPSREDNFPNTVLESLMCGTPVVGFRSGGIEEMIEDGINGFLTNEIRGSSLGECLKKSLQFEWAGQRRTIREDAIKRFEISKTARSYRDLYERVIRPKPTK